MFEIYRSRHNAHHYVAIATDDDCANANGVRESENLEYLTLIPDDREPRIAFDPDVARQRIGRDGFYAFTVTIEIREHAD
jgi:hypothetical protein